jgi:tRNA pseudouridine13 synthase
MNESLPFLTADLPGTGGVIKARNADFFVEERPLYEASGSGEHTYAFIEKNGIGTREAIGRLSRALNVPRREIGSAGLKDTHAVTRQWLSLGHVDPKRVETVDVSDVTVLAVDRHTNKLKPGHLAGNRFVIRVRRLVLPLAEAGRTAEQVLEILTRRGLPNYFGPQRFGSRGSNDLLGRAIIRDEPEAFIDLMLGQPRQGDLPLTYQARRLYEQGAYQEAVGVWPRQFHEHRRALKALAKSGGSKHSAFDSVDKHLKTLFISAYQSRVFNRVLAARMPRIDTLLLGDMAYKHANGASFPVEWPQTEQPRCNEFEISPTGPLIGKRTTRLTGPAGEIENPILEAEGLTEDEFRHMKRHGARGGRRPLRVKPRDVHAETGQDDLGPYLELHFELDSGCFATTLLAEITKDREMLSSPPPGANG